MCVFVVAILTTGGVVATLLAAGFLAKESAPMTLNDKRILTLAIHATVAFDALPSMEAHPGGKLAVPGSGNYPWDWADVTVTATYGGIDASKVLKGLSYPGGAAEFRGSDDYRDAQLTALTALLARLDAAAEALVLVGPRPRTNAAPRTVATVTAGPKVKEGA